jgi:hypothetical protein
MKSLFSTGARYYLVAAGLCWTAIAANGQEPKPTVTKRAVKQIQTQRFVQQTPMEALQARVTELEQQVANLEARPVQGPALPALKLHRPGKADGVQVTTSDVDAIWAAIDQVTVRINELSSRP